MGVLLVLASIVGLLLLFMLAEAQRSFFGKESGNLLLCLEFGVLVVALLVTRLWGSNRRTLGIGIGCVALALALGFLGWFIHPDQIYSRALERMYDWERALSDYSFELSMGKRDPDAAVRLQRLTQELAARRSEYHAAEIRYAGEAKFFRSSFFTWSFWFIGAVFAIFAIRYVHQHMRRKA